MNKITIIFIAGIVETAIYTGWALAATQKKIYVSSILMFSYMLMYLCIIDMALKDVHTLFMIAIYALSCGVGNFIRILWESKEIRVNYMRHYWLYKSFNYYDFTEIALLKYFIIHYRHA